MKSEGLYEIMQRETFPRCYEKVKNLLKVQMETEGDFQFVYCIAPEWPHKFGS